MTSAANKRLWLWLLFLGLVIGIGGGLYQRVLSYTGTLYLAEGITEHLVVTPHQPNTLARINQRNVAAADLRFENALAAAHLDRDKRYDAAVARMGLRLDRLEILQERPDVHFLAVHGASEVVEQEIAPGEPVLLQDQVFEVDDIGPWEGLLRHPRGQPMGAVRLDGTGERVLFLQDGVWTYPVADTALQFLWYDKEATARAAAASTRESLAVQSRWGVRDGQAIQWFQGTTAGSRLTLRDGGKVSFVALAPDKETIHVLIEGADEARDVRVPVNDLSDDRLVYYQDPSQMEQVIRLHAWEDGQALIQWMGPMPMAASRTLGAGEEWTPTDGHKITLNDVMSRALPITQAAGEVNAACLSQGGVRYVLREGLVKTIGTLRIAYRRQARRPEIIAHCAVLDDEGVVRRAISLRPDEFFRHGNWVYAIDETAPWTAEGVVLVATRRPGGWAVYLGLVLFVAGCVGWVGVRTR